MTHIASHVMLGTPRRKKRKKKTETKKKRRAKSRK